MSPSTPSAQNSSTPAPSKAEITASSPRHEDNDYLESLQNIPSNFDLALNGSHNQRYLSPTPSKQPEATLLDPETFRRLSISTASSFPHSRNPSPYPLPPKSKLGAFWQRNYGLFLVALSQLFGALMNVTTRLLELEGDGMHPLQILFARMSLTMLFCCTWMWWKKVPDFLLGAKGIRWLLMGRGFSGFFGIYGMYCESALLRLEVSIAQEGTARNRGFGKCGVTLTKYRLSTISPRSRRSCDDFPRPFSSSIRLSPLPQRTIPTLCPIRIAHLSPRRNPHRTPNIILHIP